MKKLTLATAFFFVTAGAAHASELTFLGSLNQVPAVENSHTENDKCADFSGEWKGSCTDEAGKKAEESFTLKQKGCEMIEVTGKNKDMKVTLPIGGTFGLSGTIPGTPAKTFGGSLTSNWDKEHKTLSLFVMGGGKKLTIDDEGKGFYAKEVMQLVSDKKMSVSLAMSGSEKKSTCEFEKP